MWQSIVVALVVLGALAYAGRRLWTTLRPKADAGCAHGCGCGSDATSGGEDWARSA